MLRLALVVPTYLCALSAAQDARIQFAHSGSLLRADVADAFENRPSHGHLARSEVTRHRNDPQDRKPLLSALQTAEVGAKPAIENKLPWDFLPLCEFHSEGNFSSLVTVFVNVDNTRAFVFDRDARGAQTKVQCHGATPDVCTKPHLLSTGVPDTCDNYKCDCMQATLSVETIHVNYVKHMVHKVGPLCSADGGANILHIGLGGGAMSSYLLDNCALGTHVTSVEKDPRIIAMAKKFFGLRVIPGRNDVENLDAGEAVQKHRNAGDRYDVVLIDCFEAHGHIPESCSNQAFIDGIRHILQPKGMVIQQVWASQYKDLQQRYETAFGQPHVSAEPVDGDKNFLLTARPS